MWINVLCFRHLNDVAHGQVSSAQNVYIYIYIYMPVFFRFVSSSHLHFLNVFRNLSKWYDFGKHISLTYKNKKHNSIICLTENGKKMVQRGQMKDKTISISINIDLLLNHKKINSQQETFKKSLPPACLLVSCWTYFFDPEDEGDMFLRNVGWHWTDYTTYIPENGILHNHRCENLKSYKRPLSWFFSCCV
jgi:hypothetical protein